MVKKQSTSPGLDNDAAENACDYVPLLNNCHQLLPGFRIQRTSGGPPGDVGRKGKADSRRKSQSPTGTKPTRSRQAKDRAPIRKANDKK